VTFRLTIELLPNTPSIHAAALLADDIPTAEHALKSLHILGFMLHPATPYASTPCNHSISINKTTLTAVY
jgi:hypothetical protein